jgi:gliding motility-associated protein GldE
LDVDWFVRILLLALLLILSALFSGSEVALFSLDKKKLKDLSKVKSIINTYIVSLLDNPRRLLVTILLGNTIFNVGASITAVIIALDLAEVLNISIDLILLIQIIVLTILILLVGEITPKVWASKHPLQFARIVAIPIYWTSVLVYPLSTVLTEIIKFLTSKLKTDKSKTAILSSELTELADIGKEKGSIEEEEHELIHGLVSFKTVTVREVMTPRVDLTAVAIDTSFDELIDTINTSGLSRLPLYQDNLDNIIGIIYAKDLLQYLGKDELKRNLSLKRIARSAMFIPENKLISDLLQEFQEKKMHVGIVVDEYGGTAGLISLEDILEEIVGEIRDEYDKEENEILKIDDITYLILGKVSIDELNELLESDFSSEGDDYDTIGGFILNHAGTIPENNFYFESNNFKFTVKEVQNKRINKVLVQKLLLPKESK